MYDRMFVISWENNIKIDFGRRRKEERKEEKHEDGGGFTCLGIGSAVRLL
jgi:hypothetical protein